MRGRRSVVPSCGRVAMALVAASVLLAQSADAKPHNRKSEVAARSAAKPRNPDAIEHLKRGQTYFDKGDFDKAIAEWEAGALIEPHVVWNFNFGQANRGAGRLERAKWNYERFVAQASETPELAHAVKLAQRYIDEIETAIRSRPQGTLDDVTAGREDEPTATHDAKPAPEPAAADVAPTRGVPSVATRWEDWTAWGLVGGGVLVGVAGALLYANGNSVEADAENETEQMRRRELFDDASVRQTSGLTIMGVGLVGAVVGVVKLAIPPERSSAASALVSHTYVGPSQVGVRFTF
jgi:tetratricopeptide (TPR) repeat protein